MAAEDNRQIDFGRTGDRYAVMLPCEPDAFADFIGGLLGRPQTTEGIIRGNFEIDRRGIENIFHLVDQRVSQQNAGNLISFAVSIAYDDDSSVTLNSYEDFLSYTETKPVVATSLTMSWIYLIKYRNSISPEKQQIDLWFNIPRHQIKTPFMIDVLDTVTFSSQREIFRRVSGIRFRISHTNRTWGNDIQNLLRGHLNTYVRRLDKLRAFLTKNNTWIGLSVFFALEIGSLAFLLFTIDAFLKLIHDKAKALPQAAKANVPQIAERLDYIIELFVSQAFTKQSVMSIVFIALSFIISGFIAAWVSDKASFEVKSFILINKESENYKERYIKSSEYSISKFFIAFIGAIVVGVLGNIAYYYVAKYLGLQ